MSVSMQELTSVALVRAWRRGLAPEVTVGLVPTMGALHAGHLALVARARQECDLVVASIFVNPLQFSSAADVGRYPRTLERDLTLLREAGCAAVFLPTADDLYPDGFATSIDVGPLTEPLEGSSRPGHFRGVATVVTKLFSIVQSQRAYFGQKDAQQLRVVTHLVADLNLPLTIVGVPTVRDADGVALSSRNALLTPTERTAARCVIAALRAAAAAWAASERDPQHLRDAMQRAVAQEPLATLDYASIADANTLSEQHALLAADARALASIAVQIGSVRLIDNLVLGTNDADPLQATL